MCGIAGYVDLRPDGRADAGIVARMCATLVHRGPDDEGAHAAGPVGLGSRRLSIIDLGGGRMPIFNEDGSVGVVFNGEIYNFRKLREELEGKGHRFGTRTDTEAIVHAWEEWGGKAVDRLGGMFAFALHDARRKTLWLARDRMGEKPLHYYWDGSLFVFASEIKAILAHPDVPRRMDRVALWKYLTYEYVPAPATIFEGIRKLGPGQMLTLDMERRQAEVESYWDIPLDDEAINVRSIDEQAEELRVRLQDSVESMLVSDVPVGVFLSGGIDSTTVAALARNRYPGRLQAFTVAFDDPSFDESDFAREAARHLDLEHHVCPCRVADMLELVPAILGGMDEPLGDASLVPTWMLSRFAAQRVKVALGGDGGDELFAGYPTFQALKAIRYYNILPTEARGLINRLAARLPVSLANISFDFKIKQLLRGAGVSEEVMFFLWLGSFQDAEKRRLLGPELAAPLRRRNTFEDLLDYMKRSNLRGTFDRVLYLCAKLYLQDDILVKVDRASMAHSLEVRAPFLDPDFVGWVSGLPSSLKLHRFTVKYLLKKAVARILPPRIVRRPKKGFGMPVGRWINGGLRGLVDEMLSEQRLKRQGIFEPEFVGNLLAEHRALKRDNRKQIWTLLAFQFWHEKWMERGAG